MANNYRIQPISFADIEVGAKFNFGGTLWQKHSTRTAIVVGTSRIFYFGQKDSVQKV